MSLNERKWILQGILSMSGNVNVSCASRYVFGDLSVMLLATSDKRLCMSMANQRIEQSAE